MSQTRLLGKIHFDEAMLAADLSSLEAISFSSAYAEFACGDWRSCVLFNATGCAEDALIGDSAQSAVITDIGTQLPYVSALVSTLFDTARLRYARLFRVSNFGLIIPHRDFLELKEDYVRLHVVLKTHEHSYSSDENDVFQMRKGEIWCLDATRAHSAAVLSSEPRIHLVMDFEYVANSATLIDPMLQASETLAYRPHRLPFDAAVKQKLMALAGVASLRTLNDIVAIVTKHHFTHEIGAAEVYDVVIDICRAAGEPALVEQAAALKAGCLLTRTDGNVAYSSLETAG